MTVPVQSQSQGVRHGFLARKPCDYWRESHYEYSTQEKAFSGLEKAREDFGHSCGFLTCCGVRDVAALPGSRRRGPRALGEDRGPPRGPPAWCVERRAACRRCTGEPGAREPTPKQSMGQRHGLGKES